MPVLKNPRHERLAQALAKGLDNSEAGKEAGYTGNAQSISDTVRENPYISVRVQELQQAAAEETKITIGWLQQEWLDLQNRAKADDDKNINAKTLENLSRHAGFYNEDNKQKRPLDQLDDAALTKLITELAAQIGLGYSNAGNGEAAGD